MRIEPDMDLVEVAFRVCTALDAVGISAVLTGGSAAALHAPGLVSSFDLDFVITMRGDVAAGQTALEDLGYRQVGQEVHHESNPYQIDFPPGPLAVGMEILLTWETLHRGALLLHTLSATDSCLDRLAHAFSFHSRKCLDDARRIAQVNELAQERMRRWAEVEGCTAELARFLARLST